MTIKQFVFQSLVGVVAAPVIVTGNALIVTGDAVAGRGHAAKKFGAEKAAKWQTQAIMAKQEAEANKLRRHQQKVDKLEAELARKQDAFRASEMTFEAELV